jgi:cholesterol transport system auxiliary component
MKFFMHKLAALSLMLVISLQPACSVFSPVKVTTPDKYVLKKTPQVKKHQKAHRTLLVAPIVADPMYDLTQMAYSTTPYEINYYTQSEWASLPSKMLQNVMVKTLINTHHFRGVVTIPTYAQYDYILALQLLELKQVFVADHSYYQVKIRAELVNAKYSTLIAEKTVSVTKRTKEMNARSGVTAANQAVARAVKQISDWSLKHSYK